MSNQQPKNMITVQGKLPCGNPNRYTGRDVVRMSKESMRGNKRPASSPLDMDDGKKTEGELHFQRLLQKQMKTDVTLSGHFSEHRTFSEATEHRPGVDELVGIHGYEEYKLASNLDSKIDFLRHCGLNDEEITIKLRQDMGVEDPAKLSGYGKEPESQVKKLEEIERKIEEKERQLKEPHATKGALVLTRQEMELEASHRQRFAGDTNRQQNANSALFIKGAQIEPEASHPDDPINHIPDILSRIEGRAGGEREPRRERRRRRKIERKMQYYKQFEKGGTVISSVECGSSQDMTEMEMHGESNTDNCGKSLSLGEDEVDVELCSVDNKQTEDFSVDLSAKEDLVEATCAPRPSDWVSANVDKAKKKRVPQPAAVAEELRSDLTFLTRDSIEANKLSITEIKQLPKFESYSPGIPNKVLYLKNLSSKTKVMDLMELFGSLQQEKQPKILFKLLTGKMRGQAFITMPDEEVAREAVQLINGYLLHGAPLIVSYGKKT
ncbi:RNA-binding protein 41-like [Plakobranchus ocellatus]|uniref:RNA-binding protein 41-like n=1 Tax=Plakobranchus ocellatus TaxID=259542 RepID=A0AAV3Y1Q4_9GAST|nr:RNA-binding protein 41-like [Plakobranchus ocellatus]